jgi:acyl-coenzyme A synthetase/AMP-(fatty) acid ligase
MIGKQSLCLAPPQWLAGIACTLIKPLFWRFPVIIPPVDAPQPLPASLVDEILQKVEVEGGFYMPSILKEMASDPDKLERLRRLKYIQFGGAPLDKWVGDLLCDYVKLVPLIGSTEAGPLLLRTPENPKDWNAYWFDPRTGVEMVPEGNGLYEMVIRRRPQWDRFQGIFISNPGLEIYHFNDLYTKHAEKDELMYYSGRKDDLFKLSWLAKVRAKDIESVLDRLPPVRSSLVGGEGRTRPFLLVELKQHANDKEQQNKIIDKIWTELEKLNEDNVEETRILRDHILLSDPTRPFQRLVKGTLDRRSILKSYEQDIDLVYR